MDPWTLIRFSLRGGYIYPLHVHRIVYWDFDFHHRWRRKKREKIEKLIILKLNLWREVTYWKRLRKPRRLRRWSVFPPLALQVSLEPFLQSSVKIPLSSEKRLQLLHNLAPTIVGSFNRGSVKRLQDPRYCWSRRSSWRRYDGRHQRGGYCGFQRSRFQRSFNRSL